MGALAVVALAAQASGLVSLFGYNTERSRWDAQAFLREELAERVRTLTTQQAESRAKVQALTSAHQDTLGALEESQQQLESARELRDTALADKSQAEQDAVSAEQSLAASQARKAQVENDYRTLTQTVEKLRGERERLQAQVDGLSSQKLQLETRQQDLLDATNELARISEDLAQLRPSVSRAQARLQDAETEMQTALADADRARKIVSEHASTTATIGLLRSDLQDLEGRRDSLTAARNQLLAELKDLHGEFVTSRNLASELTRQRDALQREVASLEQRRTQAETDHQDQLSAVNSLKAEVASVHSSLASLRIALETLQSEKAALIRERDLRNGEVASLEATRATLARAVGIDLPALVQQFTELAKSLSLALEDLRQAGRSKPPSDSRSDTEAGGGP